MNASLPGIAALVVKAGFPICRPRTGGYYTRRYRLHPKYLTGDRPRVIVFDRDFAGMSVLPPERKAIPIIDPDTVSTRSTLGAALERSAPWLRLADLSLQFAEESPRADEMITEDPACDVQ
jgi:hypothetical protein